MSKTTPARRQPARTAMSEELDEENHRSEEAHDLAMRVFAHEPPSELDKGDSSEEARLAEAETELDVIEATLDELRSQLAKLDHLEAKLSHSNNVYTEERTQEACTEYEHLLAGRRPSGGRDRRTNDWRWLVAQVPGGELTDWQGKRLGQKALKRLERDRSELKEYRYHAVLTIVTCGGRGGTMPFRIEWGKPLCQPAPARRG
jgi:hypothetical protein